MQWSRYNLMFESKNNGWLLYNSASNTFVQINEDSVNFIKQVSKYPDMDFSNNPALYFKLRFGGFLIEDGKDEDLYRILKMKRNIASYSSKTLALTIAVTRACNFACSYCYEKNRIASCINDEVENNIVDFIDKHIGTNKIKIVWYGGEPLLEFERIKTLTSKINRQGKEYDATLVTNGYLLTDDVSRYFNELNINNVQITVDGMKEVHNKRRYLINGMPTYDVVMENIDNLMSSNWSGELRLRLNVDESNSYNYAKFHRFIENKFPDKFGNKIFVYPGFITYCQNTNYNCQLNYSKKADFLLNLARHHNIIALPVFPRMELGGCTLTTRNYYVIGTEGELYKCWVDLGTKSEVIGNIKDMTNWNMSLVAEGMLNASHFEDENCKKCFYLPICDGGCAKIRMYNKRDGGERDLCSYFKKNIKEFLEVYYEHKKRE